MDDFFVAEKARGHFNKAYFKDKVLRLLNVLTPDRHDLLSLKDVEKMIKPRGQRYKGIQAVPISLIVGSEGRYRDFNKAFLPKHEHLRSRWENVDKAHIKDIILPPIKLYEIGGVYFVIDGNHRVSVAKSQGIGAIDAEVVSLRSEITIKPMTTKTGLKKAVIEYEKRKFFEKTEIENIIKPDELNFTATGRYSEILEHIECHKYYLNMERSDEISFSEAAESWYNNLFIPIVQTIIEQRLLMRFPRRTYADLYVWIIRHWDDLKKKYGQDFPIEEAAKSYSKIFGKSFFTQLKEFIVKVFQNIIQR